MELGQDKHASPVILNIIEFLHWSSFPLGFYVAAFIFKHQDEIAAIAFHDDRLRVFLVLQGLMCQVFAGLAANLMHIYEGWQVAPFLNPLSTHSAAQARGSPAPGSFRVEDYNNAWLRAVTYQTLFTFQALGLGLFTMAVFGPNEWTIALEAGSATISLLGPHNWKMSSLNYGRDTKGNIRSRLPVPTWILVVLGVNIVFNLVAWYIMFHASIEDVWPPTCLPWLDIVPRSVGGVVGSIFPPLCSGLGGAIEGAIAETSFNQLWHLFAFIVLLFGLGSSVPLYMHLVGATSLW
jgi:hypothetical protein